MTRFEPDPDALSRSFVAQGEVVHITREDAAALQAMASDAKPTARYCLHESADSDLHSMVIMQSHDYYTQPKKHLTKSKVYQIIAGELLVVAFNDDGQVVDVHRMSEHGTLVVRLAPGIFHTNMAITREVVFHELIIGPFMRGSQDRVYAPFAPVTENQLEGKAFLLGLVDAFAPAPTSDDTSR